MEKNGNKLGKRKEAELAGTRSAGDSRPYPALPGQQPVILQQQEQFSGPLPHPRILKEYNEIHPGLAERIIVLAEKQAAHRQELEASAAKAQTDDSKAERVERKRGQIIGGIVVLASLAASAYLGSHGNGPWSNASAAAIGGIPLVGLVIAFISGKIRPSEKPR